MTQISLVLPFALPPPELAPDLIRAMQAPALATLLSRPSSRRTIAIDDKVRALPYETWLARELDAAAADGAPALATQVMRGYGLEPGDGSWFIVNPSHIEIARSHLLLHDQRGLRLSDEHARALFEAAKPYFDDSGKPLQYGDAGTWFMRADDWADLLTATPDAAVGLNLTDWLPSGTRAVEYRKLQNEVQMLWFSHPANAQREAQGLASINGFWPWAPSSTPAKPAPATLAANAAPAWLSALSQPGSASLDALIAGGKDALLVCGELTGPALAADWSGWLAQMQHLEQAVFAPACDALMAGRVHKLRLLPSHRGAHLDFTTTKLAQRAFWRRPSLAPLLP